MLNRKIIERYEALTKREKEEFSRKMNLDNPLGPYFLSVTEDGDGEIQQVFFDDHSDDLYKKESRNPALVIGRRGSGKSTYVNSILYGKPNIVLGFKTFPILLDSWSLTGELAVRIIMHNIGGGSLTPEETSKLWHFFFLAELLVKLKKKLGANFSESLEKYFELLNIQSENLDGTALVAHIMENWSQRAGNIASASTPIGVSTLIHELLGKKKTLINFTTDINEFLYEAKQLAIYLLDNPEKIQPAHEFDADKPYYTDDALKGLLQLGVSMNSNAKLYTQLRICIPSEQYGHYLSRIEQPERLDYRHLLHWKSSDLLALVANRVLLFIHIYPNSLPEHLKKEIVKLDIYNRDDIKEFYSMLLTCKIYNTRSTEQNKFVEEPMDYVMRHTQLLPRQLIRFLNEIFKTALKKNNTLRVSEPEIIIRSVNKIERELAQEISRSYMDSYDNSVEIVSFAMTKLPLVFKANELKKVYSKHVIKNVELSKKIHAQDARNPVDSSEKFVRMLEEMGVVGVALEDPQDNQYINAEFEYNIDQRLLTNASTTYATHPLFSHNTEPDCLNKPPSGKILGVYPNGSS